MSATIKKTKVRGMNEYLVEHPDLKMSRVFYGNKSKAAADTYAEWLNHLAKLATEAKA